MWIGNCKKTGKFTAKMCCGSPWYLEIYKSGLSGCLSLRLSTVQFITGVTTSPWCVSRSLWFKLWCSLVTVMILLAAVDRASCTTERQFVLSRFLFTGVYISFNLCLLRAFMCFMMFCNVDFPTEFCPLNIPVDKYGTQYGRRNYRNRLLPLENVLAS